MISFNNMGYMGHLGNQMFQYAALKGIASHKKYDYSMPYQKLDLTDCFIIPKTKGNQNFNILTVEKFEFDQQFFDNCPDNVDIMGFFQSEKYFKHIEKEIREDFRFKNNISNICKIYKNQIYNDSKILSIHIRRGDYITDSNFANLDISYYEEALNTFDKDILVLIFSDDIEWCEDQKIFKEDRFIISKSKNSYIDLCLMTLCDYHIIANSSFSWWGSWLAKSKKTIAPKNWFSGEFSNWNTKDLYLPDWIII